MKTEEEEEECYCFVCTSDWGFREFDNSVFLRNSRWKLLGARGLSGGGNVVCGETHF